MAQIPLTYYIDWSGLEDFGYPRDKNGLPVVHYPEPVGKQYNPITISQYGLDCLVKWVANKQENDLNQARLCGQWLVDNAAEWPDKSVAWIYRFDLDYYHRKAPWISAMAQGEAVSLLLRLAQLEDNAGFVAVARKAVIPFDRDIGDNGVVSRLPDGSLVFQEYPTSPASHVLNGHIFALLGLYDFGLFFDDTKYLTMAEQAVESLVKNWRLWDAGYWTYYDLYQPMRLASPMYHELHIRQFKVLAGLFGRPELLAVAERWQAFQRSMWCRSRWLAGKVLEKAKWGRGR